ncbi:hypothetical protein [Natrarchaeobius oligotrophus]|uniref:Cbb3-type cytochrome c oxidase subunit I n=1 Tax=Natrarchaeobius chitinivorans TaxID=1679083 RepID=A0A3N6PLS9_NATCH|nr:hypothetical protein [Natrarchaeobius chitinivorans]RQG99955.1 hypothetical protein EA472_12065 [Natrarchaeobius chitinivorans]
MNRLPGELRTDQQPPMAIPLRHFVVALGFLFATVVGGFALALPGGSGLSAVAHVHVALLGWIGITIMGAMTQFVPVWSGVAIHSRRLAVVQLWLVTVGAIGFVVALLAGEVTWLPYVAAPILLGLWTFVYTVGRTLLRARPLDFTERHFALALACFAVLAPLGYLLAVDFSRPIFDATPLARGDALVVHATLALYGAVLVTIVGALRQLTAMFAQSEPDALDDALFRLETVAVPLGLVAFAAGRGLGLESVARAGGLAFLLGLAAFTVVVARLLGRATADRSPMTDRYWVVVASLSAWIALAVPAWWLDPLGHGGLFGHPDAAILLVVGVFAFVVVGSLYHVVPFIVWLERYSDRIGFEPVPTVDDLYDGRLERADFGLTVVGFAGLAAEPFVAAPGVVTAGFAAILGIGFCLFVLNVLRSIHRHAPGGVAGVLAGSSPTDGEGNEAGSSADVRAAETTGDPNR